MSHLGPIFFTSQKPAILKTNMEADAKPVAQVVIIKCGHMPKEGVTDLEEPVEWHENDQGR